MSLIERIYPDPIPKIHPLPNLTKPLDHALLANRVGAVLAGAD